MDMKAFGRRKMIARTALAVATLAVGIVAALTGTGDAAARKYYTFAAGGSSGSWYVGSAVMSELIRKACPDIGITPAPGGGVSNMRTLQQGKAEIGFYISQTLYEAYSGTGAFNEKADKLRAIMSTNPFFLQMVVHEDSQIHSVKDLIGKRISPAPKGFGAELEFQRLLPFYGLSYDKIEQAGGQVLFRNYDDGAKMFMDGHLDEISTGSPAPHPPFSEIAATHKIRFLPIEPKIGAAYHEKYPGYLPDTMPAGIYPGQDKPVATLAGYYGLATTTAVPDADVYCMTKAIYEGRKRITEAYGAYKTMLEPGAVVKGLPIPMHPAAEKYFREAGILK
jgi:uncharacterized protein